eukprot:363893-Chlamydomonas_euryale.AAC.4
MERSEVGEGWAGAIFMYGRVGVKIAVRMELYGRLAAGSRQTVKLVSDAAAKRAKNTMRACPIHTTAAERRRGWDGESATGTGMHGTACMAPASQPANAAAAVPWRKSENPSLQFAGAACSCGKKAQLKYSWIHAQPKERLCNSSCAEGRPAGTLGVALETTVIAVPVRAPRVAKLLSVSQRARGSAPERGRAPAAAAITSPTTALNAFLLELEPRRGVVSWQDGAARFPEPHPSPTFPPYLWIHPSSGSSLGCTFGRSRSTRQSFQAAARGDRQRNSEGAVRGGARRGAARRGSSRRRSLPCGRGASMLQPPTAADQAAASSGAAAATYPAAAADVESL